MELYTLDESKLRIELAPADGHTVQGGQVAVAALCIIRHLLTLPAKFSRHARGGPLAPIAAFALPVSRRANVHRKD